MKDGAWWRWVTCPQPFRSVVKEKEEARLDIYKYKFGFVELTMVKCAIELCPMTMSEISSSVGSP